MTEVTAKVEQRHKQAARAWWDARTGFGGDHLTQLVQAFARFERDLRPDDALRTKLEAAIKVTQYKYFGDYEFSQDQADAVETLVDFARAALNERNPDHGK